MMSNGYTYGADYGHATMANPTIGGRASRHQLGLIVNRRCGALDAEPVDE